MTQAVVYLGAPDQVAHLRDALGASFTIVNPAPEPDAVRDALTGAVAVLDASMKVRLTREMFAQAPALRIVATATTGSDHIDADALRDRSIPLLTLKGQHDLLRGLTPAAEHSWLLLMAAARRATAAHEAVMRGEWNRSEFPGVMLRGKTLGVIGLGRIGRWMSRYASAFDMRVQAVDPAATDWPDGVTRVDLETLLATSDFVSLHVHLSDDTRGLLSAERIARLKPGAIVVNTSRGDLIDERALVAALESGRVGGAGVDVLAGEPEIADNPLRLYAMTHDNVVITPHIGGFSPDAVRTVVRFSAGRIVQYLEHGTL